MSTPNPVQVAAVAARSADTMRKLAAVNASLRSENSELRDKVASYERNDRIREIASQMEEKGLNAELTYDEKIASLAGYSDLDRVEEAVKMASSGSLQLASVSSDDDSVQGRNDDAALNFAQYCVTGDSGN